MPFEFALRRRVGRRLIPDEVVIRLSKVGGKVASFLHNLWQQFHAFGKWQLSVWSSG